jgi:hypothetical protein
MHASRTWTLVLALAVIQGALACGLIDRNPPPAAPSTPGAARWGTSPVFSRAHATTAEAVRHHFGVRPDPQQPFPFPHNVHAEKQLGCTEYCHEGVTTGPVAGIPSVKACMICHAAIASDRPLIKSLADFEQRGIDIAWQRVYGYTDEAHVRFNHAPHIRAKVECSTCHGDVAQQTVAERQVDMTMSFCVDCHKSRQASTDCLVCHY